MPDPGRTVSRRQFNSLALACGVTAISTTACTIIPGQFPPFALAGIEETYRKDVDKISSFKGRIADSTIYKKCAAWAYRERLSKSYCLEWDDFGLYSANIIASHTPKRNGSKLCYTVCAHLDSVSGTNGANDNASGAAAVIALSDIFAGYLPRLKHEVRFILFGSEELGRQGSLHYASKIFGGSNPDDPSRHRVINIDTIAAKRMESAEKYLSHDFYLEYWSKDDEKLAEVSCFACDLKAFGEDLGIRIADQDLRTPWVAAKHLFPPQPAYRSSALPSDHLSYREHNAQSLSITQYENYASLHKPSDGIDKIDYQRGKRVVDWLARFLYDELT